MTLALNALYTMPKGRVGSIEMLASSFCVHLFYFVPKMTLKNMKVLEITENYRNIRNMCLHSAYITTLVAVGILFFGYLSVCLSVCLSLHP